MEATATPATPQNGASVPTGLGQVSAGVMYAPTTLPPLTPPPEPPPAPAVTADTTPLVSGVEIPIPGVTPPASTDGLNPVGSTAIVPTSFPGTLPLPTYTAPVPVAAAPATSSVPTWAWVLGGTALLGLLGFIAWSAMRPAVAPAGMKSNPLSIGHGTQRRFRRVRRAKPRRRAR